MMRYLDQIYSFDYIKYLKPCLKTEILPLRNNSFFETYLKSSWTRIIFLVNEHQFPTTADQRHYIFAFDTSVMLFVQNVKCW